MAVTNSSSLLAKLENVNWCYSINTVLQGVNTNLLIKFIVEENAYAIMVSDFSSTYFECLVEEKIVEHYTRFNNKTKRLSYQEILQYLSQMLLDLRTNNSLSFEKLQVDCHTSRITVKTSKLFTNFRINWNFYIISTEPDVFMKHFSMPVWRGLMHFYQLSQNQNHFQIKGENDSQNHNHATELVFENSTEVFHVDDATLKDVFR